MRARRLSELVELMQPAAVEVVGDDTVVGADVVLDNRKATPGSLFIAIPGSRVDGHSFAPQAVAAGAAAVLGNFVTEADVPHILVEDTVQGLSWLARGLVREERARGMVSLGVTGSSGKTSTKDLLAQVLEAKGTTVAPTGSQNNEIGVPLTACRIDGSTQFLVSEMGSRGVGHIEWLTSLVGLDVGIVLNIGRAHVGEFGGLERTARAKSEIITGLGPEGWAVLNADDPSCRAMRDETAAQVAWFGEGDLPEGDLQVAARDVVCGESARAAFTLVVRRDAETARGPVRVRVGGSHEVSNALAAAAAGLAVGMTVAEVAGALSVAESRSDWRMEVVRCSEDRIVLNDAYNANPDSMAAALRTAANLIAGQRRSHPGARAVAVLGDMHELGPESAELHAEAGTLAADLGIDELLSVGEHAGIVAEAARARGIEARVVTREEAAQVELAPGDLLLVKGSRSVGLELVADAVAKRIGGVPK